jgi:hypothetical protein
MTNMSGTSLLVRLPMLAFRHNALQDHSGMIADRWALLQAYGRINYVLHPKGLQIEGWRQCKVMQAAPPYEEPRLKVAFATGSARIQILC